MPKLQNITEIPVICISEHLKMKISHQDCLQWLTLGKGEKEHVDISFALEIIASQSCFLIF